MKKYHYTYRITNKILNKHYYGIRSSDDLPKEDLGTNYFSSSTDEEFIEDQKQNPSHYKYKIVRISKTRKEALELEVFLHEKFNVSNNDNFYNRAKQGNYNMLPILKGVNNPASRHIGVMDLDGNLLYDVIGNLKSILEKFDISKNTLYRSINKKRVIKSKYIAYYLDNGYVNREELLDEVLKNENKKKIKNTNKRKEISSGAGNPNSKLIGFYKDGKMVYTCNGNRKEFCKIHYCSMDEIRKSLKTNKPMYQSKTHKDKKLSGFQAKYLL